MITHGGLANAYLAWQEAYGLATPARTCRWRASRSTCFPEIWCALCARAASWCWRRRSICSARPSSTDSCARSGRLRRVRAGGGAGSRQVPDDTGQPLDFMRLLVVGSDSWSASEYAAIGALAAAPRTRVINAYGVSEATIDSTFSRARARRACRRMRSLPIGRALRQHAKSTCSTPTLPAGADRRARRAVHRRRRPGARLSESAGPDGRAVRSAPVRGAARRAAVPDRRPRALSAPTATSSSSGGIDDQVKLRGFRIELGEIEAVLRQHAVGRRRPSSSLREDEPGDKRLVALCRRRSAGARPNAPSCARFVREKLPEYMVPSAIVSSTRCRCCRTARSIARALPAPERERQPVERVCAAGERDRSAASPTSGRSCFDVETRRRPRQLLRSRRPLAAGRPAAQPAAARASDAS